MTEETVEIEPLETLAKNINACIKAIDTQILEAATLIRAARDHFDNDERGKVTWKNWTHEHIKLSGSRLRELQRIADADDPQAELGRIRELNKERQARYRGKNKKKTAPLRNGGETEGTSVNLEVARDRLIDWARSAPLRNVILALAYAKQLGDDEAPNLERSEENAET